MSDSYKRILGLDWPCIGRTNRTISGERSSNLCSLRWTAVNSVVALFICTATIVHAQWQTNGVAVCDTLPNGPIFTFPRIATDAAGGAYVCWRDIRNGDLDIYAQRVDSTGNVIWQRNGIAVVQAAGSQDFPRIVSDAQGNAFIAWEDSRAINTFPYVQKLNRNGQMLWQTNGVKAAEVPGIFIDMACDRRGGVILAWTDVENVFVQRLDSLGNRVWGDSAVQVTDRPGTIYPDDIAIANDGDLGAVVVWSEGETYHSITIYGQRIDSAGRTLWPSNGVALSDALQNYNIGICIDTSQWAVIASWGHSESQILAQKLNKKGDNVWSWGGIQVGDGAGGGGPDLRTLADGQGGAFLGHGRWIQHLDSAGMKLWAGEGAKLITAPDGFTNSTQTLDGWGGVFNFMEDFQQGFGFFVLVQWIDRNGNPRFGPDGAKITPGITSSGRQFWPVAMATGKGSSIVCWNDNRRNSSAVYVTRIDTNSVVTSVPAEAGNGLTSFSLEQNYPNPFNPETAISFQLPAPSGVEGSAVSRVSLKIYNLLGQEVATLVNEVRSPGTYTVRWDGSEQPSGVYFYRLEAGPFIETRKMVLVK